MSVDDTINIGSSTWDDSLCLDLFKESDCVPGNLGPPVSTLPTVVDAVTPDQGVEEPNSVMVDPALGDKFAAIASHQVSINLSCTTGQLSNIMSLLASTGLVVNIKIDTN
jgi:hypothetical protein